MPHIGKIARKQQFPLAKKTPKISWLDTRLLPYRSPAAWGTQESDLGA